MDRFGQQHLVFVILGMMALMAGGFLFLLFRTPPHLSTEQRLTDYVAERAAGTLETKGADPIPKEVEVVDIEGVFEKFEGTPGTSTTNWPNLRGTDFRNIVESKVPLATSWPPGGPPKLWELDLGEGYAGAALWEGCVYVIDYDEEKEGDALRCFSFEDGKEIWRRFYKAPTDPDHGVSRTVPAVNADYVVSLGPRGFVLCVSRESGDFRWGIDMVADYGTEIPDWYTGQCPLIDGSTAVLAPAGTTLMMGVNCETGEVLWKTPNPNGWKMSHSSIVPMTLMGKKTYVYCAVGGVVGVSAEEEDRGTVLWESSAWAHKVLSPSPVRVDESRIFLTVGVGGGSMMLKLKEEGGQIVAEPAFELEAVDFGCEQQTPIFYRDHLFAILPKDARPYHGQFACINTAGEVAWRSGKTDRFGLGPFLLANDLLYLLGDHGELTMIKASTEGYHRLAQAQVLHGADAWGPMVLVDGKLILRDSKKMICLDVAAQ